MREPWSDDDVTPPATTAITPLTLIVEADGSMIPVVQIGEGTPQVRDKRKHRTLSWKEARLSLVRRPDEVEPTFDLTLGDVATTGAALKRLAVAAGLNPLPDVHGVGDGAPWIAERVEIRFAAQGHYLIDFYHLCDYLAAAAPVCAPGQPSAWMICQKERLKAGQLAAVMAALDPEHPECTSIDPVTCARVELFGLAQLMLMVMKESADQNTHTHGGAAWKAFARALLAEHDLRQGTN